MVNTPKKIFEDIAEAEFEAQLSLKRRKKTRTGHSAIYAQLSKMPEMPNIIVTEREMGIIQRRIEKEYGKILSQSELEARARREKLKRMYG